jgi:putative tryptophan/tyrosine transport system substrate-binding protein
VRERSDALHVGGDTFLHSRRSEIVTLAASHGIPATYPQREWVEAGGLMSYGTNFPDVFARWASMRGAFSKVRSNAKSCNVRFVAALGA